MINHKSIRRYLAIAVFIVLVIVILGFVLPIWFYFNAPSNYQADSETTCAGQKLLFNSDDAYIGDQIEIEGDYWTPGFFTWDTHHGGITLYTDSSTYVKKR
jgi:hypothetical protein